MKGNLPLTGLHYSKCHPKPTPFSFKGKKNIIYKTVNKEQSGYSQSMYKDLQVCQFRPLPQTNAHLSLTKHNDLNQPVTGDSCPELYKKQKNCLKSKLTNFSFQPCLQRTETFHSAHQGEQRVIDLHCSQVRNATTLDAENSADYIYLRPSPQRTPCKRPWH